MTRIAHPTNDPLTQGMIFTCAVAEDYPECEIHGLIITARCDAFNDKAPIYNYVPIVKFDDWLVRDAATAVAHRVARAAFGDMGTALTQAEEAKSLLDYFAPAQIFSDLFGSAPSGPGKTFKKALDRYDRAQTLDDSDFDARALFLGNERSEARKLLKELLSNSLAEFHYLPNVEPDELDTGYVALLREIRHLPRSLAKEVAKGLDHPRYDLLCEADSRQVGRLALANDRMAWPVGILTSPDIELVLQRLTLLFARVGVTDLPSATLKKLESQLPQTGPSQ